jgi:hypothetical protein
LEVRKDERTVPKSEKVKATTKVLAKEQVSDPETVPEMALATVSVTAMVMGATREVQWAAP